jgi:hypothetical protein
MNRGFGIRLIAGLVLLAALAGLAYFAFNAGMARGVALNTGESGNLPEGAYGYGRPYYWHAPFFAPFGFLGCLLPLFLIFLVFGSVRWLFWGRPWGMHHHGPWRGRWNGESVPPMFAEWHRRAHGPAGTAPGEASSGEGVSGSAPQGDS